MFEERNWLSYLQTPDVVLENHLTIKLKSLEFCKRSHHMSDSSWNASLYFAASKTLCLPDYFMFHPNRARIFLSICLDVIYFLFDFKSSSIFYGQDSVCMCGADYSAFHLIETCPRFSVLRSNLRSVLPKVSFVLEFLNFSPIPREFIAFLSTVYRAVTGFSSFTI